MIPYFQFTSIHIIGPFTIQVWGLLVSLGIVVALVCAYWLTKKHHLSTEVIFDATVWALMGAFVMARVFHIVFYELHYYVAHPEEILKFWHGGASSLGGFVGAAMAVFLFLRKRKISWNNFIAYFDIGVSSLWLGWGIGRLGCFLIHDHPGTLSHFLLAVKYPGGARHDLGLYDSMVGFCIFLICLVGYKKKIVTVGSGTLGYISILIYTCIRFFLDFLRSYDLLGSDVRYAFLTPAQWGMLLLVAGLIGILFFDKLKPKRLPAKA